MPTLLYLVTEDWFFVSHFLPMARGAKAAGFDVAVAARAGSAGQRIAAEGFRLVPLRVQRGSMAPYLALRDVMQAYRTIRTVKPDIVHCIALRPVVLGGIATRLAGTAGLVVAPTGLGSLWVKRAPTARLLRAVVRMVIASWLHGPRTRYLFENCDDPKEFGLSSEDSTVAILGGAGVDPRDFPYLPEPPAPPLKVAVVARMIEPKGIAEAVEAVRRARARGAQIELDLFGEPDPANPHSIAETTLRAWSAEPGVCWRGRTDDVARVWREHHVALYLSYYREGVPRALIEAAASGRPIVTTDMPGCRELVRDGREGFLVRPGDVDAAADALVRLAADPILRARLGEAANAHFQESYTEASVQAAVTAVYRSLMEPQ